MEVRFVSRFPWSLAEDRHSEVSDETHQQESRENEGPRDQTLTVSSVRLPKNPHGLCLKPRLFFFLLFSNAISFIYSFILYNPNGFTCLILLPYQLIDQSFFRSNQERELTLFLGMLQVDYEASSLLRIKLCQHKIQYVNVKK